MADNYVTNTGSGGDTFAADDIAGVKFPRVKLVIGADGSNDGDVASGNPIPVTGTVNAAQSGTWNVTNISGTVSLPTGAATAAKQPALGTAGTPSSDVITVQGAASMTAIKTDGSAVTQPVSGTVSITANSAVNVAQINGVATSMGNGVSGTGVQRVTIASDSTGQVALAAGSNTIGALTANQTVDINRIAGNAASAGNGASGTGVLRVTIANDSTGVVGLNAGTNLVGRMSSSDETSTIYNATTALTPKFAAISAASSGNNTLVAAVTSKKVRVLAMNLVGAAAQVNAYITDGAGGSAIWAGSTNKASLAQYGGFVLPYNPVGWFETTASTALVLNLSGATAIGGSLTYVEV